MTIPGDLTLGRPIISSLVNNAAKEPEFFSRQSHALIRLRLLAQKVWLQLIASMEFVREHDVKRCTATRGRV